MGPPRRKLQETVEATLTPPGSLAEGQSIARIVRAEGKNLYTVTLPTQKEVLVELAPQFRSTIWLKKRGFVLVDTTTLADRENKICGEIVNVVRDERAWRKHKYWPEEFVKKADKFGDDEQSTVGKMPPSDPEDVQE